MPPQPSRPSQPEIIKIAGFALLGLLLTLQPIILLIYFLTVNIYYFYQYSKTTDVNTLINLVFFLPSIEILGRVIGLSAMPVEIGKYMGLIYFVIFSLHKKIHSKNSNAIFIVIFLLNIPSLLFADFYQFRFKFVHDLLGLIDLSLLGIFFSRITITLFELKLYFKNFLYSLIPFLVILTIKTPKFSEIKFDLGANFVTSAGFGPNQVCTVLGAAIFILILYQMAFEKKIFTSFKQIDLIFIVFFSFRALITFSRGGILAPIAALILPSNLLAKFRPTAKIMTNFITITFFSGLVFFAINSLTGGSLIQRFSGETTKTIAGTADKSIEGFTTGRSNIIAGDINVWFNNIVFGAGIGESAFERARLEDGEFVAAHTEFSRLLAEQGLFGLAINIMLLIVIPLEILAAKLSPKVKYIKLTFILFSVISMAHSAMRTIIPVIFYAFSAVNFSEEKKE
jgi:hypothetical protein